LHGFITLHKKIEGQSITTVPWYQKGESEAIPVPILGPDLIDPRQAPLINYMASQIPETPHVAAIAEEPAAS
jgi:hypothetical protein